MHWLHSSATLTTFPEMTKRWKGWSWGNVIAAILSLAFLFLAFYLQELVEAGSLNAWVGAPCGFLSIMLALLSAQFITD